jgi:hypothetical protein
MKFNEIGQNYCFSSNTLVTKVFVTTSPFHPSLLFVAGLEKPTLRVESVSGSTWVHSSLACKFKTRVTMTNTPVY